MSETTPKINKSKEIKEVKESKGNTTLETKETVSTKTKETEVPMNKSQRIRALLDEGKSISEVAEIVGVRYNFVYNVASRYMDDLPTQSQQGESKSQQIRDLLDAGKTVTEIKKALGLDYNFVYGVKRQYDAKKARDAKRKGNK